MNSKQNTTKKIWLAPTLMNLDAAETELGSNASTRYFEGDHIFVTYSFHS